MVAHAGGLIRLGRLTAAELGELVGVSPAAAQWLCAALELNRRIARQSLGQPRITAPADVAALLPEMNMLDHEEFRVVTLDTKGHVLRSVYKGIINQIDIQVAEVFKSAVRLNARQIVVAHNRPSGVAEASPEDIAVTRNIVAAGALLGIDLLEHLIIGHGNWLSMRTRGLGFAHERHHADVLGHRGCG